MGSGHPIPRLPRLPHHSLPAGDMSDEEYAEEESVSNTSRKGDGTFLKARGEAKKGELDEQLKEYINEWRKQRAKEEEELKKLKDKQAKRKEEAEKKAQEAEEKRKKLEEAEKKRQEMMKAQKEKMGPAGGNKSGSKKSEGMGNVVDVRREMTKTKEQLEEEKKISLSIRISPLELDGMDSDDLKTKASELWELIVKLETERYDLEERTRRQDYDLKELKERRRQQNKQKAIKLGLDPEALA